ncbi:MAG TPA: hypothetical protein VG756_17860 [Pseudonocardiaceae bacterium]|jgi:hypothetical protein|nr:hypothetical protein [Pseudonocardiaceae bacterium]
MTGAQGQHSANVTTVGSGGERERVMGGDPATIGRVGTLTVGTRGPDGPGEVLIKIRGGSETYLAWSDEPMPKGTAVLVVETRGARAVNVVRWTEPSTALLGFSD